MTGRYQHGFDFIPTSFTSGQVQQVFEDEGWFGVAGAPITIVSPGRFGYGARLQWAIFNGVNSSGPAAGGLFRPLGLLCSAGGWVSAGLNIPGGNGGYPALFVFDAVANIFLASVSFEANGVVRAWSGAPGAGTLLGSSDAGAFRNSVDFDVECFFKVNASTGEIEVRIDTASVLHLVSVNTQPGSNAYFDSHGFGHWVPHGIYSIQYFLDDYRVYDTAGSINNSWLGTMRVQTCLPAANGATTDFTRSNSSLANWQNIANTNVDDSLYLLDGSVGDFNLSEIQPLVNAPAVAWVGVLSFLRQDDATQITAKNRIVSGASTEDGAAFLTTQSYSGDFDIFEADPATGVQFTGAAVNALQVGPLVYAIA